MIKSFLLAGCLFLGGCGPLILPMVPRISAEEQTTVDQMWKNMLNRPQPLDRQVLLDTICLYYLYGGGLDQASYHAEKQVGAELVVMDVNFDRYRPMRDSFCASIFGPDGKIIRQENYSRSDVEEALGPQLMAKHSATTQPANAQEAADQLRMQWRIAAVAAATQPAATRGP